jgi:membrane-bound ClpP family serine protease
MKNVIKEVAKDYNINPKALKRYVKKSGIKPKEDIRLQVLEVIYINCPELFYCRADEDKGTVEYLDINLNIKLCNELKELRGALL